jgi:hypothetical protein
LKDTWGSEGEQPEGLASLVRLITDRAANVSGHKTKICFFLGAGADISSGGLSFADLKRQAVEEFTHRILFDVTTSEHVEARFEELFISLAPDDRALLVESLFRRLQPLQPSDAYKLLVLLTEAGAIDAVVTTNFDLMLESAQSLLGRDVFQVFGPGLARPYLVSHSRYELPKKPYLKLHGDLASRSVVLLTGDELDTATYDASMLGLLTSILQTHDLILVGYSGYDRVLARIVGEALGPSNRVYWCNPREPSPDSPLYARIVDSVINVRVGFDDLVMAVARPVLERPTLAPTEPTYLRCLFEWRVDFCNREYVYTYGERGGKSLVDTFARRRSIENRLTAFLRPNRPLALIVGPSGYGKTTVGLRLHKLWRGDSSTRLMLIRSRALADNVDLEQYVAEQLGGLGSHGPFTLFQLEHWLRENELRLILFVDAVNEFSADLSRCVQFFRSILRFCYFLPEHDSALRVIATIRQETWHAMLPHVDMAQLRKALWSEHDSEGALSTIACGAFTDEELRDALLRLREHGRASISTDHLAPAVVNQLRDPFLLSMVVDGTAAGLPPIPSARIYQRALETKLRRRGSFIDVATIRDILAATALQCLGARLERFREVDIQPPSLRSEVLRLSKDLGVIVDAGDGFLQFDHDRTFEYFLAIGFGSRAEASLETLDDLRHFLHRFRTASKALAAARLYYQLAPKERFPVLANALRLLDGAEHIDDVADRELLFGFAHEVLAEMVEAGEPLAELYLSDAVGAVQAGTLGAHHLRTIVHCVARLPAIRAVPLLSKAAHAESLLAGTEATIYATDKLVREFLLRDRLAIDLLHDEPFATFLGDRMIAPWQRLGRLLGVAAQLGPDNTHSSEYARVLQSLDAALDTMLRDDPWAPDDAVELRSLLLQHCDRLLFNATPHGIGRFFGNPRRRDLEAVVDRLAAGAVLSQEDFAVVEPYTESLAADIEYHLAHVLFILSSLNDLDATLRVAEAYFSTFSDATPPEKIDFFQAILVYLHVLHGHQYDEGRFRPWEEVILQRWPSVLLYRPGIERGERRGFHDPFDRVFEDGFGVIYAYGTLRPSARRVRSHYVDYRREIEAMRESPLPMYTEYLERYLRSERIEEALQLLQALAGTIVIWPTEGLLALRTAIGCQDPRVRRATVRVLAEAYHRHPNETMQFLQTSGAVVTDDELIEITVRQDARIGRRQVEEEEWSRVGHFLLRRPGAKKALVSCVRELLRAESFDGAITGILQALGLVPAAGR